MLSAIVQPREFPAIITPFYLDQKAELPTLLATLLEQIQRMQAMFPIWRGASERMVR